MCLQILYGSGILGMYFACSKIVWLPKILAERGFPQQNLIPLHVDNTSAIQITANHVFCEKTKHIAADCHTIREAYDDHIVIFPHVTTALQITNIFTKSLPKNRHFFIDKLLLLESQHQFEKGIRAI